MKGCGCLLFLVGCLLLSSYVRGATYANLDALTTALFSSYKANLRPFVDNAQPTFIYMGIWLMSIEELDEIDQSLTFSAFLYMDWIDHRLSWSSSAYNNTQYFAYPQQYLWIPDITITNTAETMTELGFDRNYLYVSETGTVQWLPGGVYKISCDIDITYYPFDTQICTIIISTLVSRYDEIDLETDSVHATQLRDYSPSGTWDLVSFTTVTQNNDNGKTRVGFQIKLKRKVTYYVIAIILPVLFLSLTATLVFALPADSGEKMGTSITVLLAFAVYLTIVSDQMPKTSNSVSVLSIYLTVLLAQTALGVIMSVWVLNLHFRDDGRRPPGTGTLRIAHHMQRLMCKVSWRDRVTPVNSDQLPHDTKTASMSTVSTTLASEHLNPNDEEAFTIKRKVSSPPHTPNSHRKWPASDSKDTFSSSEMMSWKEVAFIFDRFLFYAFSIFLLSATVIFLIALVAGGETS